MISVDLRGLALLAVLAAVLCGLSAVAGGATVAAMGARQLELAAEARTESRHEVEAARVIIEQCVCAVTGKEC